MIKLINHKPAVYVAVLLMLSLLTQLAPQRVIAVATVAPPWAESMSPVNEVGQPKAEPVPTVVPDGATITATLTDNITAATRVAPGGTINYTATITNTGSLSPAETDEPVIRYQPQHNTPMWSIVQQMPERKDLMISLVSFRVAHSCCCLVDRVLG